MDWSSIACFQLALGSTKNNAKNTRPGQGTSVITRGSTLIQLVVPVCRKTALIGMSVTGMTRQILTHKTAILKNG
jgi:hypothetical protein